MRLQQFFFLITFLCINSFIIAQNYKTLDSINYVCHYTYTHQEDSLNKNAQDVVDMCLYIGSNYTKFEHSSGYVEDSLLIKYKNEDPTVGFSKAWPLLMGNPNSFFSMYQIIKKTKSNNINLYEIIAKVPYTYEEELNYIWQLSSERDTIISTLKCKKAYTHYAGRKYIAWYSTEIPLNTGPYKFHGLPGLIIKIEDTQQQIIFELNSFEPINYTKPLYHKVKQYKSIDNLAYINAKRVDVERLIKRFSNPQKVQTSIDKRSEIEIRLRNRNNFIERL